MDLQNTIVDTLSWLGWTKFDLRQQFVTTVLQTLFVAPMVSIVIAIWQRRAERSQRVKMVPHIVWSTFPIRLAMDQIVEGPDGDFVRGGLEIFARQYELQTEKIYDPEALSFYLGHPQYLSRILKERVASQCDYVDGLLDLFAPHFRTGDSVSAQRVRSALREIEKSVSGMEEGVNLLAGNISSTCKFLAHLRDVDTSKDIDKEDDDGQKEGKPIRDDIRDQALQSMQSRARELINKFDALPSTLDDVAAATMKLVEGFYEDRLDYTKILKKLEKNKWFREEHERLAATLRRQTGDTEVKKE